MPKISVILTSRNHENFLREAIDSVLAQSWQDFELIIWDDASSDDSWSVIQSFKDARIQSFRNKTQRYGVYGVNKAIGEIAKGEYIAIHHSDDIWESDKLIKQLNILDSKREVGAVFTWADIINDAGEFLSSASIFKQDNKSRHEWLRRFFIQGNALCHPSVLIRKQCYLDCGLYRSGLWLLPDFDMWIRLCLKYDIFVIPEPLVQFRWHTDGSNSSNAKTSTANRANFESFLVLDNFSHIYDIDEVLKIFPSASKYCGQSGSEPGFVLAMAAIESNQSATARLFGQQLLFKLISDPQNADKINKLHNFDHMDFMEMTKYGNIFSTIPNKPLVSPLERGIQAYKDGDKVLAIDSLTLALQQAPNNPLPSAYLAFICVQQGMLHEAIDFFKQSTLAAERADLKAAFGESLLKAGHSDLAAEYLHAAIDLQPDLLAAYPALAQSLHLTGRSEEAVSLLQTAASVPSDSQPVIRNVLLQILAECGDLSEFTNYCLSFSRNTADDLLAAHCLARHEENGETFIETLTRIQTQIANNPICSNKSYCPVCNTKDMRWLPLPPYFTQSWERYGFMYGNAAEMTPLDTYSCSACGASDRERLYAFFLKLFYAKLQETGNENEAPLKPGFMLHFAPEPALSRHIISANYFTHYKTVDMTMPGVDFHADLQCLPFDNDICDFFICSHVLEHVTDDRKAMKELYRITKPGGCGLLMTPVYPGIKQTLEDPSLTDESQRWRLFGQNDHVRLYSHDDYVSRIEESGFSLQQLTLHDLGANVFKQLGLKQSSILYIVRKP
jgi:glycosyltransferase involved in cell wall biosynthesis/SAM-dependent methyltransferase/Tfp pilus assembly protein PilF